MASLVCPCARGGDLWGEFWWVGREYKWVFFDDDNTSETFSRAGYALSGVRQTPGSEDAQTNFRFHAPPIEVELGIESLESIHHLALS